MKRILIRSISMLAALFACFGLLYGCGAKHGPEYSGPAGLVPWISANSPGNGQDNLSWGAAQNAVAYDIYREVINSPSMPDIADANAIARTDQTSYKDNVDIGLYNGAYYWIVGVDGYGIECLDYYGVLNSVVWIPLINGTPTSGYTKVPQ